MDIMPRAWLLLKGFDGRYQVQLVAGNKRLVEALGEKTQRDLDFARFDHTWTLANVEPPTCPLSVNITISPSHYFTSTSARRDSGVTFSSVILPSFTVHSTVVW
ncbi:hypothetical protein [Hymenobacter sp. CRA2]|uniref:hypothetical protein n=1 Tax=Hymenobacter sp. CRA2 TaxID=1955620 RepID=UPI00098F795F|nr:hypothetical protein [Hymenobacter sp. CRA2]OON67520.1 hypothetical protein B0919_16955 [Hymenobacter sp. CRA2]